MGSDVYQMPPLYLRVFLRLAIEANHQDNEIPYKERGQSVIGKKLIKRGERLTSVRDICKWVAWYERGKLKEPNPKTIQNILDWLEENNMIEVYGVKGNRKETHYSIVNYDTYQDKDSDKVTEKKQPGNSQVTEKQQSLDTNKNVKNDKNDKKEIYSEITDFYNSTCLSFPRLTKLSDARKKSIKARLNTYTIDDFKKLFTMAEDSDFLKGGNDRNWSANFDWLIKDANMAKVLDGNFKNSTSRPKQQQSTNKFNQYPQRAYTSDDYAELERKLTNKGLEDLC